MIRIAYGKFLKYLAVIGLLVLLSFSGVLSPLRAYTGHLLEPLMRYAHLFSSSLRVKYKEQLSKADYNDQLNSMQAELDQLRAENARLRVAEDENANLRKYLDFPKTDDSKRVLANIISRGDIGDQAGRIETMLIDKGEDDGIRRGMVVTNEQGIVVGKVKDAKESISELELVMNDDCRLAATIYGQDRTSGIVEGKLGLTMDMGFIPQSEKIDEGDLVISSGLEELIPRGLVIGKVSKVRKENNELWQTAVLESSIDFDRIMVVAVLIP